MSLQNLKWQNEVQADGEATLWYFLPFSLHRTSKGQLIYFTQKCDQSHPMTPNNITSNRANTSLEQHWLVELAAMMEMAIRHLTCG